jgi:hypothetical protein
MVTPTGPGFPPPLLPRTAVQTEALARLEATRQAIKDAPTRAAAAQLSQIGIRLTGINFAAGSAVALGDPRNAAAAVRDTRRLVKDLTRALQEAGLIREKQAAPRPGETPQARSPDAPGPLTPAEFAKAQDEARGVLKALRKIVVKLRLAVTASQIRGADPQTVKNVQRELQATEKELAALTGTALGAKDSGARKIDLHQGLKVDLEA